jgi:phosphonate transport system permease protein
MSMGDGSPALAPPTRSLADRGLDILVWGGVIALLLVSFGPAEIHKLPLLFTNSANIGEFSKDLLRPDFGQWRLYVAQMWLTVQIALWGTGLAVVIAIPFGLLCARNIAPIWIQQPMRRLMDLMRSIPDLVLGTIFIVAVGLGPFAGVMALAINTCAPPAPTGCRRSPGACSPRSGRCGPPMPCTASRPMRERPRCWA